MIIGSPYSLAIESGITEAYERPSFLALGYFVIHIKGVRYGLHKRDATLLACSFEQVQRRIEARGSHVAHFAEKLSAEAISDAFRVAVYGAVENDIRLESIPPHVYESFRCDNEFVWAPDGDTAFDDGSYVLQFDVGNRVRLIGFRCNEDGLHDSASLSDLWIASDEFYRILSEWHSSFWAEWTRLPKTLS